MIKPSELERLVHLFPILIKKFPQLLKIFQATGTGSASPGYYSNPPTDCNEKVVVVVVVSQNVGGEKEVTAKQCCDVSFFFEFGK